MDASRQPRPQPRSPEDRAPILSRRSARQGVTGHNVRYVLGFSLAAVVIAFVIIYLLFFGSHPGA
jgi:hypothetical protein